MREKAVVLGGRALLCGEAQDVGHIGPLHNFADRQIQADARSGRLDELYARLESENAGQPDEPLDEFFGRSKLP